MTSHSTLSHFLAAALLAGTTLFGSAAQAADLAAPKELPPEAKPGERRADRATPVRTAARPVATAN